MKTVGDYKVHYSAVNIFFSILWIFGDASHTDNENAIISVAEFVRNIWTAILLFLCIKIIDKLRYGAW